MKKFLNAALLIASLCSGAAQAETYLFSYTFGDGPVISGSMTGHLKGDLLEGIADVHATLNGTDFVGPLFQSAWNSSTHNWDNAMAAVVSTDVSKNNFIFGDADAQHNPNGMSNYFFIVNGSDAIGRQAFAINCNVGDCNDVALDTPANASWSLVAAPVPEPATGAMLLAGLGLVGALARRRAA